MKLHAQIFDCQLTNSEMIVISNISAILSNLLPEVCELEDMDQLLQEVDLCLLTDSLKSIIHGSSEKEGVFRSYIIADVILKMNLTIKLLNSDGYSRSFSKSLQLFAIKERIEAIYKYSLDRHLSKV